MSLLLPVFVSSHKVVHMQFTACLSQVTEGFSGAAEGQPGFFLQLHVAQCTSQLLLSSFHVFIPFRHGSASDYQFTVYSTRHARFMSNRPDHMFHGRAQTSCSAVLIATARLTLHEHTPRASISCLRMAVRETETH